MLEEAGLVVMWWRFGGGCCSEVDADAYVGSD
jgi:hypothetical protein